MNIKHTFVIFSLFFFTLTACDSPNYSAYQAWDLDEDGYIDAIEYNNTFANTGYYETWDEDGNDIIDEAEWKTRVSRHNPDYDYDTYGYTMWDVNEDQGIDEEEFTTSTYRVWDTDGDGKVDAEEFQAWDYDN